MGVQENADLFPFWSHDRMAEEKATKESVLERIQFLSGQEYEKREFSEEMRM